MNTSPEISELAKALSDAQGMMPAAKKDGFNPHFKTHFSSLSAVLEAIKIPLFNNGLSFIQVTYETSEALVLVTRLMHDSGQWVESELRLIPAKDDMQGLGGALTYAKRYALSALLGVAEQEDDDGQNATAKINPKPSNTRIAPKEQRDDASRLRASMINQLIAEKNWPDKWVAAFIQREYNRTDITSLTDEEFNLMMDHLRAQPARDIDPQGLK